MHGASVGPSRIRFYLFRDFRIVVAKDTAQGLVGQKSRELLCYLLLHRERPFLREVLMTLLWEECDASRAKKHLRQTLWQLRNDLRDLLGDEGEILLQVDSSWVRIDEQVQIWIDVEAFEKAFRDTQGVPGRALGAGQAGDLKSAETLYQGDLLEGCYQDWCLFERERLQNIYLLMLDKLMDYCEANILCEQGIAYGMRILQIDHAQEKAHRRMMRLYHGLGDRTSALRQYERCAAVLREELGVAPSQRTEKLLGLIQTDSFELTESRAESTTPGVRRASIPSLVFLLSQVSHHLAEAHSQARRDIETAKEILLMDE